jgi:hypothetical protein
MPNAGKNYFIYLYRNKDGEIELVEDELRTDPDPGDTTNPPDIPTTMYPLIVKNATNSAAINAVDFDPGYTLNENVAGGNEFRINLPDRQYSTVVTYTTTGGQSGTTTAKNVNVVQNLTAQSWHLLYLWFYKTKIGNYSITQVWPPVPNDAAEENQTVISGGDGGLIVINKSENGSQIIDIDIDGTVRYDGNANGKLFKDDSTSPPFILNEGTHNIRFRTNKTSPSFGPYHSIAIKKGEIRTLSFYDALDDLDSLAPDAGYGVGMIKIENESGIPAFEVEVVKQSNTAGRLVLDSSHFQPVGPVNNHDIGRVDVVGNAAFPVEANQYYLIYVKLQAMDGTAKVVQKIAYLKDRIVTIRITAADLPAGDAEAAIGATIKVKNTVPTTISGKTVDVRVMTAAVYDTATYAATSANTHTWNPGGPVYNYRTTEATFPVYDTPEMPITQTKTFRGNAVVIITVSSGDDMRVGYATPDVALIPNGNLYSTTPATNIRTLTVDQASIQSELNDLLQDREPVFVPVTDVTITNESNIILSPGFNFQGQLEWTVDPGNATNKNGYWVYPTGYMASYWDASITPEGLFTAKDLGNAAWIAINIPVIYIIPNGIAPGPRNCQTFTVTMEGEVISLNYDATKDFIKLFNLGGGGTGGMGWKGIELNPAGNDGAGITYVAYSGSRWVAMSSGVKSYWSNDGISWNEINTNFQGIADVVWGANKFVALSTDKLYYSSDGISWSSVSPSFLTGSYLTGSYFGKIAYGNGRFIIAGDDAKTYYSTDGISWSYLGQPAYDKGTGGVAMVVKGIANDGANTWIMTGQSVNATLNLTRNNVLRSTDNGQTWTEVTLNGLSTPNDTVSSVAADGAGNWVIVGASNSPGGVVYFSSNNGTTWTSYSSQFGSNTHHSAVAYGNNQWVVTSQYGRMYKSSNGQSWTLIPNGYADDTTTTFGVNSVDVISDVAWGGGRWVASGYYYPNHPTVLPNYIHIGTGQLP